MVPHEQIERFFKKQCTAYEAKQVAAWLKTHPEIADQFLEEAEWQNATFEAHLPKETTDEILESISRKIRKKKSFTWIKYSAAAACIAGCVIAADSFYFNTTKPAATAYHEAAKTKVADTTYNYTNTTQRIILEDSSVVLLSPHATVWLSKPFAATKREVYLKGEAGFEVAKNKQKPFTVYAGAFSTTALGTQFTVKQINNNIKVQLLHGKVVIKALSNLVKNWKDVYLSPGQQMTYNERDALVKVSFIQANKATTAAKSITKKDTERETTDSLIFNGSSLSTVLHKLHRYYNVNIQFADSDLKNRSFTGVIVKKDAVQNILKVIAQMNNLLVEKTDSSFIISRYKN